MQGDEGKDLPLFGWLIAFSNEIRSLIFFLEQKGVLQFELTASSFTSASISIVIV
jgi:hypothetical protein